MSVFDVRDIATDEIKVIRFADECSEDGAEQACIITNRTTAQGKVFIYEGDHSDSVRIVSAQHAKDLIKALEKVLDLEWLS